MRKIFLISFLFLLLFTAFLPQLSQAATCDPCTPGTGKGLVPCGQSCYVESPAECDPCQLCHLFVLFDNIVKFVLQKLVPPIAALMLVFGGSMFFAAAGDPAKLGKAKGLLTSVAIGLVIIYGAYLIISLFFLVIGVNEWTGLQNWFMYPCVPSAQ